MGAMRRGRKQGALLAALALAGAAAWSQQAKRAGNSTAPASVPSLLERAQSELLALVMEAQRASWVQSTYITDDTEALAAKANQRQVDAAARLAKEAATWKTAGLPADQSRQLQLLRNGLTIANPAEPARSEELSRLMTRMEGTYGKGKYCPPGASGKCLDINGITRVMANSRDPRELLDVWQGWHRISKPLRDDYQRYVSLANQGAKELGFADTGAMWRAKYDMPPDQFAAEVDRLWEQVKPLYTSLHAYVRWKLREKYGADVVPERGPIPAHLLGNLWAQSWENIYPLVAPRNADPGYDLTKILANRKTDAKGMTQYGEGFFTSLGMPQLPPTFYERSMFVKPPDREVVCHASAWHIDLKDDVRIKMCIEPTAEDFTTIHHELGHVYYFLAYQNQPSILFRDGANDGFHEAIGDTIALSITPEYLVKLGLLDKTPSADKDIGLLLGRALEKIAFLPFGLLVDKWRWQVFNGQVKPGEYNQAWWALRRQYQGVAPPVNRTEADFDAGAKYHVPASTPYMRYFLADILQFQFHRALAKEAGCTAPLHRCSIYGNEAAGKRLWNTLALGSSKPWPDALQTLTGQRQMDATAIRDYFAPLQQWLDEQNKGHAVGW